MRHVSDTSPELLRKILILPTTDISTAQTLWAFVESCSSIIAACLPTMAPLFRSAGPVNTSIRTLRTALSKPFKKGSSSENSSDTESKKYIVGETVQPNKKGWQTLHTGLTGNRTTRGDLEMGEILKPMKARQSNITERSAPHQSWG